jgi:hypothetical protein
MSAFKLPCMHEMYMMPIAEILSYMVSTIVLPAFPPISWVVKKERNHHHILMPLMSCVH